jgi:hypothetical protein
MMIKDILKCPRKYTKNDLQSVQCVDTDGVAVCYISNPAWNEVR